MDARTVQDFVEQSRFVLESTPGLDAENTRAKLVQPFIDLLGWDLFSPEVTLEYSIDSADVGSVDYALFVGNSPLVFVEAVGSRASVDDALSPVGRALHAEETAEWGIATNGTAFCVIRAGDDTPLASFDLADLKRNPGVLDLLSKEAVRSGRADELATDIARIDDASTRIREREPRLVERLTATVHDEFDEELPLEVEAHAREFVGDLLAGLEARRRIVQSAHVPDATVEPERSRAE